MTKRISILLAVTSAVMVAGDMAVSGDLIEVDRGEALNITGRGKARYAVPNVDYDPAEYPDVANHAEGFDLAADEPAPADAVEPPDDDA